MKRASDTGDRDPEPVTDNLRPCLEISPASSFMWAYQATNQRKEIALSAYVRSAQER